MIVTLTIPAESQALIERHAAAAAKTRPAIAGALAAAVDAGAEKVREELVTGDLDLVMRHPGSGLAASVMAWMLDEETPLAAVGVPSNAPAIRYARILEEGGTIRPVSARALAVPISDEARDSAGPRTMPGLFMIRRPGRPPLLAEKVGRRILVHWVLLASVTIVGRQWLRAGMALARPDMEDAFGWRLAEYTDSWKG